MLGQLLHSITPSRHSSVRQLTPLESVTEDEHTRSLLYPDAAALHSSQEPAASLSATSVPASMFPVGGHGQSQGELELDPAKDVRIIVAQDEAGALPNSVLFDSKSHRETQSTSELAVGDLSRPSSSNSAGASLGRRTSSPGLQASNFRSSKLAGTPPSPLKQNQATHIRRSSSSSEPPLPRSPPASRGSAFQYNRLRGVSFSSMTNIEENHWSRVREGDDLVKTCVDCMFGNTTLSYRGPSTKLHIIPTEGKSSELGRSRQRLNEGFANSVRGEARKRSTLAQSYTPGNQDSVREPLRKAVREVQGRTVLITRTFSVSPWEENDETKSGNESTPTPRNLAGEKSSYSFPHSASSDASGSVSGDTPQRRSKQRRSPMYAVGIIIQLPAVHTRTSRNGSQWKAANKSSTSRGGGRVLGSSLDSARRSDWVWIDPVIGADSPQSSSLHSEVDDRVDIITKHWDVILRTLTTLQFTAQERIGQLLKIVELNCPIQPLSFRQQGSRLPGRDQQALVTHLRTIKLTPNALSDDRIIQNAATQAVARIVRGIKIPRVVTGQGRWGIWREEARWVERWAGSRDQNFFFYYILTAFLGSHSEWLSMLSPAWYRRRYQEQHRSSAGEDLTITNRTVIVSTNKMAARRLIFILSAFLPASLGVHDAASPKRPGTATSFRAYSQSPPVNTPISRQHSLRRSINRRGRKNISAQQSQVFGKKTEDAGTETAVKGLEAESKQAGSEDAIQAEDHSKGRQTKSNALPIHLNVDVSSRKGSSTTTSTVTPEAAVPVAHIAMQRGGTTSQVGEDSETRPRSSGSLASANLMHTLQRNNSGNTSTVSTESQSATRWGSLMSFWSGNRGESSTDHSEMQPSTDEGLCIYGLKDSKPMDCRPRNDLQSMVNEVGVDRDLFPHDLEDNEGGPDEIFKHSPEQSFELSKDTSRNHSSQFADRTRSQDPLYKMSINETDGVIEVDIPLPELTSPLHSPLMAGFNSLSSMEGSSFGQMSTCSCSLMETDHPIYAAGWLKNFHPDFALQAVGPYPNLEAEIKQAMSSEPTPLPGATTLGLENGPVDKWIDVCTSIVADAQTFTVKRIRLRRRVRLFPSSSQSVISPRVPGGQVRSQYGNPYAQSELASTLPMAEQHLEEEFSEEPIRDMDGTLVDAVERLLLQSGETSYEPSATSSCSSSQRGRRNHRSGSDATQALGISRSECKERVIGALREVVNSVTAELSRADKHHRESQAVGTKMKRADLGPESTLRDGIRKWLSEVEEAHH